VDQRQIVHDFLLPPDEEPTEAVHPGVSALDHPASSPRSKELSAVAPFLPSSADVMLEPIRLNDILHLGKVVPLIQADPLTDVPRGTEGSGVQRTLDELAVIPIGGSHHHTEGNASTVGEEAALHARLPSVGGVWAGPLTAERGLRHRSIHRLPGPVDPCLAIVGEESLLPQPLEDPGRTPFLESIVNGALWTKTPREGSPLNSRSEDVHYPGQAPSIIGPWYSSTW
jgi:hypothetical protein